MVNNQRRVANQKMRMPSYILHPDLLNKLKQFLTTEYLQSSLSIRRIRFSNGRNYNDEIVLHPKYVSHNYLASGVCFKLVA